MKKLIISGALALLLVSGFGAVVKLAQDTPPTPYSTSQALQYVQDTPPQPYIIVVPRG